MQAEALTLQPGIGAPGLAFEEVRRLTPEVIRFLETISWGSQGVLYTYKDLGVTLRKLPPPLVVLLRKHEKLIATQMVLIKSSGYGAAPLDTSYTSMLAVTAKEQGNGYGKQIAQQTLWRQREQLKGRGLMYAYVEAENEFSNNIFSGLGYSVIGQFHATLFGRLSPKISPRVIPLSVDQEPFICEQLTALYAGHALADFDTSLRADQYWVLQESGDILAGVQVDPQRWEIQSIPGAGGQIAQHVLPRIPVLKGLFNPRDFRFLKFGNIYFKPGRAAAAFELFETMLGRYGMNAAMMYWDKRSSMYRQLATAGGFGLLNALAETPVNVWGCFEGFRRSEIADFCQYPLCISPIDL